MTTLNNIVNPANVAGVNNNFDIIEDELTNKVLKKTLGDGEDNTMLENIDMNSNRILNLPTPTSLLEPVRLKDLGVTDGITINLRELVTVNTLETNTLVTESLDNNLIVVQGETPVTITLGKATPNTSVFFMQDTVQQVTFVAEEGVVIKTPLGFTPYTRYSVCFAYALDANTWVLGGDLG